MVRAETIVVKRPVLLVGIGLVLLSLGFRGWILSHSWFAFDDFQWISEALRTDLTLEYLLHSHAGHLMPAGFLLTWFNVHEGGALGFAWPALQLLAMQAVAGFGCLRLLRHMFGERLGILPPLAVFLFTPITLPAATWWAAGVNQLPVIIAIVFGLHAHVSYLRTRRTRYVIVTLAWIIVGLLFSEKTILAYAVFGLVAFCYFATGHFLARLRMLWSRYRTGIILELALLAGYLPYYLATSINFDAEQVNNQPLADLSFNMIARAFASAIVGGPLHWASMNVFFGLSAPSDLFLIAAWVTIGAVVLAGAQSRVRSKRAWSVVGALMGANVLLVATGRANIVGPSIGLEYRYQTEVAIAAALSLALAFLPLLGADESAEQTREHGFVDSPLYASLVTGLVVLLAGFSSIQFMALDLACKSPERYYANFQRSLTNHELRPARVPMADLAVPLRIWAPFAFPSNLYRQMFAMYAEHIDYRDISSDSLYLASESGRIRPMTLKVLRHSKPTRLHDCGYVVRDQDVEIPLNGPVIGFGWWIRIAYQSTADSPVTITIDDKEYTGTVESGLHSLFVKADGQYDSITVSGLENGARLCTNDVTLGTPEPFEAR